MANQALVKPGDLVFDPFVGSGSLAIACTHLGAQLFGADIDMRVLSGKAVGRPNCTRYKKYDIFTNFDHYGLERPQISC